MRPVPSMHIVVGDLLDLAADAHPGKTVLIHGTRRVSYGELKALSDGLARRFVAAGLRKGDRVVVSLRKSIAEVVALFAVSKAGGVFVPASPLLKPHQARRIAQDVRPRFTVIDPTHRDAWAFRESGGRLVADYGGDSCRFEKPSRRAAPRAGGRPPIDADLAAILYTSGSTGWPKGVMLTHRNLVLSARSVCRYMRFSPDARLLNVLPFTFDYGLNQLFSAMMAGACVVLCDTPLPGEVFKLLRRHRITGLSGVPTFWIDLLDERHRAHRGRFPHLRFITNSGGSLPRPYLDRLRRAFPGTDIYLMYGQTEGFRSTYLPPESFARKRGSIGRALPNVEVFVVHPRRGLCRPGQSGELIHRGSLISQGYWRDPAASRRIIKPNRHLRRWLGNEKVLHTGDYVRMDRDGDLTFVGRRDALIKTSGYRVSPTEVEEGLCRVPEVAEAVAFGVPDPRLGQAVAAVLRVKPGRRTATPEHILRQVQRWLPRHMVPREIDIRTDPFPKTAHGKVDRPAVQRTFRARPKT